MHRIDGPGFAPGNLFTVGDPAGGIEATTVTDDWHNACQEEIANVIEGAGDTLDKSDNTQLLQAVLSLSNVPLQDNGIVNGDFRFAQLTGLSVVNFTTTARCLDMFENRAGTGGTPQATVSRQPFTLGQTDVPGDPEFYMRHQQTQVATVTVPKIITGWDDVKKFAGLQVTMAVYLRVTAGTQQVVPAIYQHFGTGGFPSAGVKQSGSAWTVGTIWQEYTFTTTLGTMAGKMLGNVEDFLQFQLELALNQTHTIEIADWRVTPGASSLAQTRLPGWLALQQVERFIEKSHNLDTNPNTVVPDNILRLYYGRDWSALFTNTPGFMRFRQRKSEKASDRNGTSGNPKLFIHNSNDATVDEVRGSDGVDYALSTGIGSTFATSDGFGKLVLSSPPVAGTELQVAFGFVADAVPTWQNI